MQRTVKPNAIATPSTPTLNPLGASSIGNAPVASTAVPQPPNTSTIVPMSSAMKILTLLSFTSPPNLGSSDKDEKLSGDMLRSGGPNGKFASVSLRLGAILIISLSVLSGCKAQASLDIRIDEGTTGTVTFELKLDDRAASAIRKDAYEPLDLVDVFKTKELEEAGFEVEVDDNKNGDPSNLQLKASFENQTQLNAILSVFAPRDVLNAEIEAKKNLLKEKQNAKLEVDVIGLKKMYLEDEDVQDALEQAGISPEEFEKVIEDAFSATELTVTLENKTDKTIKSFDEKTGQVGELVVSTDNYRSEFLILISLASLSLLLALILLWRARHTPRVLFKEKGK